MKKAAHYKQKWQVKLKMDAASQGSEGSDSAVAEVMGNQLGGSSLGKINRHTHVPVLPRQLGSLHNVQYRASKLNSCGTVGRSSAVEVDTTSAEFQRGTSETAKSQKGDVSLSKIFGGNLLENFMVDDSISCLAQIRATFYPKFENERTDLEIRMRMIEMVSKGLATLEVSLKHSGSLFMYAGHNGGAYAKNSFGNIYTAVGVFVLSRAFREAWGAKALGKEAEFNNFLEKNRMCVSMELVTAVLGDHGQRPQEDYVVVTAVTELGNGKPKFYSTPEVIAFCRIWRLPTNHVWLFSSRKSVTSFFTAYDALCEEGTATPVCRALDEVADISVTGSVDHIEVQGEILEGLVARIVSHEGTKHMEEVLRDYPPPPAEEANLGPSLRDICAANRSDEKQQIKALLQSVGPTLCPSYLDWLGDESKDYHSRNSDESVLAGFLQSHPADYSTMKLQEMIRLMREKRFRVGFKSYVNFHRADDVSNGNLFYKMVVHVRKDSVFRKYQKEMRHKPGLWPLYRGFFIDINFFKSNNGMNAGTLKSNNDVFGDAYGNGGVQGKAGLADDDDASLMIKLKFLTYKLRTFLIRDGLSATFSETPASYKAYYLRQMKTWGTSTGKQRELSKMLDEWAVYVRTKYGDKQPSSAIYLSDAEPFLEQYAKRSPQSQVLIGSAGNLVRAEDFLAIVEGGRDEEGDLVKEEQVTPFNATTAGLG